MAWPINQLHHISKILCTSAKSMAVAAIEAATAEKIGCGYADQSMWHLLEDSVKPGVGESLAWLS
jgi:hypothetical protein